MTEHRSLDEFAGGTDDSEEDEAAVADADGVDAGETGGVETAVVDDGADAVDDETAVGERVSAADPVTSTSRYDPTGVTCAACDAEVVRLWAVDDEAVCVDCKPW